MEYYWELCQHDGTRLEIIPGPDVDVIKRRMQDGQPINTRSMVIPANQVRYFRQTDKPYSAVPLLEEVAQAFNEPQLTPDGSIVARWVKKHVTHAKWDKFYAPSGYRRLPDENAMVVVAFRLPVHAINANMTSYCTDEDLMQILQHN